MVPILIKSLCYIGIIAFGYILRYVGFFQEQDFYLISRIVLKITLPAAIVCNLSGADLQPSMLICTLLGIGCGAFFVLLAFLITGKSDQNRRAFFIINLAGFNIGNFTTPFVQGFLGPLAMALVCLFDTGNAMVCLGGTYGIASMITTGEKKSFSYFIKVLVKSVPFDTYVVMTFLAIASIRLPGPVISFAGIIAGANSFLAMLMVGVGFKLSGNRRQISDIAKILTVRYSAAILLALVFYFLLPLPAEARQALTLLAVSPLPSAAPPYTAAIKGDFGLSSAVTSASIVVSIVLLTAAMMLIL